MCVDLHHREFPEPLHGRTDRTHRHRVLPAQEAHHLPVRQEPSHHLLDALHLVLRPTRVRLQRRQRRYPARYRVPPQVHVIKLDVPTRLDDRPWSPARSRPEGDRRVVRCRQYRYTRPRVVRKLLLQPPEVLRTVLVAYPHAALSCALSLTLTCLCRDTLPWTSSSVRPSYVPLPSPSLPAARATSAVHRKAASPFASCTSTAHTPQ